MDYKLLAIYFLINLAIYSVGFAVGYKSNSHPKQKRAPNGRFTKKG